MQQTRLHPSLAVRDTADIWGGEGLVTLNKLQVSGTLEGGYFGFSGWRLRAQIFRTDGQSLWARIGDIQTVDNIEAINATRLFEVWVECSFGPAHKPVAALRLGLIDLNADFDSTDPASLLINSSHGIGPDLSRTGLDGPSIFPVSALGGRLIWNASAKLTIKAAVFDGLAGDPGRPHAFAAERLARSDGTMWIGEVDDKLTDTLTLTAGAWAYSLALQPAFVPGASPSSGRGVFAVLSTATPNEAGWAWWVRAGLANPRAQTVDGYLGGGLIYKGVFDGANDRVGFAVARAEIGDDARRALHLPRAETTFEASYQAKLGDTFAIQPDVQYVVDPAGRARRGNALVAGARLILTVAIRLRPSPRTQPILQCRPIRLHRQIRQSQAPGPDTARHDTHRVSAPGCDASRWPCDAVRRIFCSESELSLTLLPLSGVLLPSNWPRRRTQSFFVLDRLSFCSGQAAIRCPKPS